MKTLVFVSSLLVLWGVVLSAQDTNPPAPNTAQEQEQAEPHKKYPHKGKFSCEKPNPERGYAENLRLPKATRIVKVYNVDYPETGDHDPICLNKEHGDTIFWWSGSGKRFKLSISPRDAKKCGKHPFAKDPPSDLVGGYFSDAIRKTAPVGCIYDVQFKSEDGKTADPHIQIAGSP